MNFRNPILTIILFLITSVNSFSQNRESDSLWKIYSNVKNTDEVRWNAIHDMANSLNYNNPDSCVTLIKMLIKSGKVKNSRTEVISYSTIGNAYVLLGDYKLAIASFEQGIPLIQKLNEPDALAGLYLNLSKAYNYTGINNKAESCLKKALELSKGLNNFQLTATIYNSYGSFYLSMSNYSKAIEYFFMELKECEKAKIEISGATINIGGIYADMGDYPKSFEFLEKGIILAKRENNKNFLANALYSKGSNYYHLKDYENAIKCFKECLQIYIEISDKHGEADIYHVMGCVFSEQKNKYSEALENFLKAQTIFREISAPIGESLAFAEIGNLLSMQHNYSEAISSLEKGLVIARKTNSLGATSNLLEYLYNTYKLKGDNTSALKYYEEYIVLKDSMFNDDSRKTTIQNGLKYEYDKQAATDSIKSLEEAKLQELKHTEIVKEQKMYASGGIIGFVLMLVVAGVSFRAFKIKQKSNLIITQQKHIVEEKHKEITDSINYAERIQRSFLATKNLLDENLKDYFVYFQPKDVVSGDFYWGNKLSNGNFILVTADSTGHGVPGAIMSILNISSLEKAVDKNLSASAEILNHTRATIIDRLKKDGSSEGGKDGMDCSLICFDFRNQKISYSAANNPIWIIRNDELIELKPDKMPVGKSDKEQLSFTQNEFNVLKNDIIYTLTDGFPDQFGGEKGKKFMHKRLKEYLISISHYTMEEQNKKLEETFNNWMGENEQVDDVSIIGIRI